MCVVGGLILMSVGEEASAVDSHKNKKDNKRKAGVGRDKHNKKKASYQIGGQGK